MLSDPKIQKNQNRESVNPHSIGERKQLNQLVSPCSTKQKRQHHYKNVCNVFTDNKQCLFDMNLEYTFHVSYIDIYSLDKDKR